MASHRCKLSSASRPLAVCGRGQAVVFTGAIFFLIAPCDAEQARPVVAPGRFGQPGEASHKYGAAMPSMQRRRAKRLWKFVEHKIENVRR